MDKTPIIYNLHPNYIGHLCNIKPHKVKGIVLHFWLKSKPWDKNHSFNNEWKSNLQKSELINLKNNLNPNKSYTKLEIYNYSKYLENREKKYFYRQIIWNIRESSDMLIGLFGIFLREYFPKIYILLKK